MPCSRCGGGGHGQSVGGSHSLAVSLHAHHAHGVCRGQKAWAWVLGQVGWGLAEGTVWAWTVAHRAVLAERLPRILPFSCTSFKTFPERPFLQIRKTPRRLTCGGGLEGGGRDGAPAGVGDEGRHRHLRAVGGSGGEDPALVLHPLCASSKRLPSCRAVSHSRGQDGALDDDGLGCSAAGWGAGGGGTVREPAPLLQQYVLAAQQCNAAM